MLMTARVNVIGISSGTPGRENLTSTLLPGFPFSASEVCETVQPRMLVVSMKLIRSPSWTPACSAGVCGNTRWTVMKP